jgi:hypothetical protein
VLASFFAYAERHRMRAGTFQTLYEEFWNETKLLFSNVINI